MTKQNDEFNIAAFGATTMMALLSTIASLRANGKLLPRQATAAMRMIERAAPLEARPTIRLWRAAAMTQRPLRRADRKR